MKTFSKIPALMTITAAILLSFCSSQKISPDEQEILTVIDKFFQALAEKDSSIAESALLSKGYFHSVREEQGKFMLQSQTHEEIKFGIPSIQKDYLERIWATLVLIRERIAVVWTQYDFHIDGDFSHGGIDIFNLVKTEEGWKIAGALYSVEPDGAGKNPEGPVIQ